MQSKRTHKKANRESLYRTRWLMAHNRLHAIAHKSWKDYLKELKTSEAVSRTPA
jgi:hypothetical protein